MNLFIQQNIVIHSIKIDGISNSSVFQIGSAGMIRALSQFYNTGCFTQPAPVPGPLPTGLQPTTFYVPLVEPVPTTTTTTPTTTPTPIRQS